VADTKRDEIIEAALRVFAAQGFHKATIKQIAAEAGLSAPSLIYWYFKDKNDLLIAAITRAVPLVEAVADPTPLLELAPEQFFALVASAYFNNFLRPEMGQMMLIFLSEASRIPEVGAAFSEVALPIVHLVTTYLKQQIERGVLRPHDPQASARAFVGMLLVYALATYLFPPLGAGLPDSAPYADEVVGIFLKGLTNNAEHH